jgi:hypothetical protein
MVITKSYTKQFQYIFPKHIYLLPILVYSLVQSMQFLEVLNVPCVLSSPTGHVHLIHLVLITVIIKGGY